MPGVDSTLGFLQLGGFFSTLLFGIISLQTFDYFHDYPKDRRALQVMVFSSWASELGHTILVWHALYYITVTRYGHEEYITSPPQTLYLTLIFSVLTTTITGVFFANRIQILSQQWLFPVLCYILLFLELLSCFGIVGALSRADGILVLHSKYRWLMSISLILQAVVDVLMTAALCYWLWRIRRGALRRTRRVADSLITWAIESTIVKSGACVLELILFLTRNDLTWGLLYLIQSGLHLNSMLVSLNSRMRITSNAEGNPNEGGTGGFVDVNTPVRRNSTALGNRNIAIQMSRVTEIRIETPGGEGMLPESDTKLPGIEFSKRTSQSLDHEPRCTCI